MNLGKSQSKMEKDLIENLPENEMKCRQNFRADAADWNDPVCGSREILMISR